MDSEFILNDLIAVERKLERLAEERKKGAGRDKATVEREIVLFERMHQALNAGNPPARYGNIRGGRKSFVRVWFSQPQADPDRAQPV